ncbi:hypothetical protein AXG93_942s1020 [Marchantia polymorpha subsp. ruderalis]|uniref:Uncharacterized protein n=1 Tax=Marchantia polymorpha subsp. ruderalis TaxID=1480154 RepID=A0A176WBK0_MARPO|nr:hypothetical protein AXG93_942s1020 [Marchantia polymorpha subsp. ruderalis]
MAEGDAFATSAVDSIAFATSAFVARAFAGASSNWEELDGQVCVIEDGTTAGVANRIAGIPRRIDNGEARFPLVEMELGVYDDGPGMAAQERPEFERVEFVELALAGTPIHWARILWKAMRQHAGEEKGRSINHLSPFLINFYLSMGCLTAEEKKQFPLLSRMNSGKFVKDVEVDTDSDKVPAITPPGRLRVRKSIGVRGHQEAEIGRRGRREAARIARRPIEASGNQQASPAKAEGPQADFDRGQQR